MNSFGGNHSRISNVLLYWPLCTLKFGKFIFQRKYWYSGGFCFRLCVRLSLCCKCSMLEQITINTHPNHSLLRHTSLLFHLQKCPTIYHTSLFKSLKFNPFLCCSFQTCRRCMSTCTHFHSIKVQIQVYQQHLQVFISRNLCHSK